MPFGFRSESTFSFAGISKHGRIAQVFYAISYAPPSGWRGSGPSTFGPGFLKRDPFPEIDRDDERIDDRAHLSYLERDFLCGPEREQNRERLARSSVQRADLGRVG